MPSLPIEITDADPDDLPAIVEIYNDVIATSTAIFSDERVTLEERRAWHTARLAEHLPVLVARDAQGVAGFGSYAQFRPLPGYRSTVEHSVHVRADRRQRGVGRRLVEALLERATSEGRHAMIAGVDGANVASIALHERLGFVEVGRLPEVALKFDRWVDLVLLERLLTP